jgi:hypothetical protein
MQVYATSAEKLLSISELECTETIHGRIHMTSQLLDSLKLCQALLSDAVLLNVDWKVIFHLLFSVISSPVASLSTHLHSALYLKHGHRR